MFIIFFFFYITVLQVLRVQGMLRNNFREIRPLSSEHKTYLLWCSHVWNLLDIYSRKLCRITKNKTQNILKFNVHFLYWLQYVHKIICNQYITITLVLNCLNNQFECFHTTTEVKKPYFVIKKIIDLFLEKINI